jgi:integrase/recombinase XerD
MQSGPPYDPYREQPRGPRQRPVAKYTSHCSKAQLARSPLSALSFLVSSHNPSPCCLQCKPDMNAATSSLILTADTSWPVFWDQVRVRLRQAQYRTSTLRIYRHVLRDFAAFLAQPPAQATPTDIRRFLTRVSSRSASWVTVNLAALRAAFDKVADRQLTTGFRTPKRPDNIPEVLSPQELQRLQAPVTSLRDRLVLGLLSDCGLKSSELCTLRWSHVAPDGASLQVLTWTGHTRSVSVPAPWSGFLATGKAAFTADAHVIPGRRAGQPCRPRTIERIIRHAAQQADLSKIVTAMTLRHTHAVTCLRIGMSERELQVRLGHATIETTLLYRRIVPVVAPPVSPVDKLNLSDPTPLPPARSPGIRSLLRAGVRFVRSWIPGRVRQLVHSPIPSGP